MDCFYISGVAPTHHLDATKSRTHKTHEIFSWDPAKSAQPKAHHPTNPLRRRAPGANCRMASEAKALRTFRAPERLTACSVVGSKIATGTQEPSGAGDGVWSGSKMGGAQALVVLRLGAPCFVGV